MKRILLVFLLMCSSVCLVAQTANKQRLIGDVNGDGKVDIADVVELTNMLLEDKVIYAPIDTVVIRDTLGIKNGHDYVDLGLSVKWATTNIGASKPEEYGKYYAWAETSAYGENPSPYSSNWNGGKNSTYLSYSPKTCFTMNYYKWATGGNSIFKYNTNSQRGLVDDIEEIELQDDAANANWHADWYIPSYNDWGELRLGCYWQWTNSYNGTGIKGYIVYKAKSPNDKGKFSYTSPTLSATYSLNDVHIFLPCGGFHYGNSLLSDDVFGYYWTSTLKTSSSNTAYCMFFDSTICKRDFFERAYGYPIRPVRR